MELTARVFGLNSWTLLIPQALEGVATVGVLYTTVRRWFGPAAGIIAGAVMAVTPVATLMFRFDNPDAMLVLLMTLAAYATTRAIESGRTRWIALAGALLGLGYLAKMLQAFLVLPGLALAYLICGKPRLGKRIWQLLAGAAALLVASGLVGRDRPAHPRRGPSVRRRLHGQQHPQPHVQLQRARQAHRRGRHPAAGEGSAAQPGSPACSRPIWAGRSPGCSRRR